MADHHATSEAPMPTAGRPHHALAGLVDGYAGYDWHAPATGVHRGLPSTSMTLVFAFDDPLDVGWYDRPATRRQHWSVLSGLHTGPAEIHHRGRQRGIQVGVSAEGARLLFGLPMQALAAEMAALDDVVGPTVAGWAGRLQEQPSWPARYLLLDDLLLALCTRACHDALPRSELREGRRRFETSGGQASVRSVADAVGWSPRHFRARFAAEFGIGPKEYARLVRFDRSKQALLAGRAPAEVAAATGYADQAHLTREWRALAGYGPREWQRVEVPFLQDLGAGGHHDGGHD